MKKDQEKERACKYFANVAHKRDKLSWKPQDIEDLHKHAKKHKYCPYYSEKFKSVFADIIFMPYNQIIDVCTLAIFSFYTCKQSNSETCYFL